MLEIHPITSQEIPLVEQLAYDYNCELDPDETRKEAVVRWIASVYQETAAGRHCFWLGHVEGQVVGFVSFQMRSNPFTQETYGFIEDLYVAPAWRRHGYTERLARAAFAELPNVELRKSSLTSWQTTSRVLPSGKNWG